MLPIRIFAVVNGKEFEADAAFAHSLPSRFRQRMEKELTAYEARKLPQLQAEKPPRPQLPFVWSKDPRKNAKARAWYFANKVKRGSPGGRYARTGTLQRSWQVTRTLSDDGGTVLLENVMPGAQFVVGSRQVPGHQGNWLPISERAQQARTELELLAFGALRLTALET